ncbi:threonine ammonia-lyase IlvA [Salegentibacter mishustinae]|uniref:L-threonine dehydratase n=1 Tax=Salegentibacter mishustinae TaxID=270918 RepID=A0A0Q9Z826_9FLAO|nr:threonine ammonia-lyase IlvA [Salegentibacter mishustinae]KRG29088.1 threonine dehydratase [Salegentibacter mishustinae]PNW21859.1 threonine dehydratase [Salegentibacter mishustinae]PZX65207.1 L-threonine ammonia-lyase [Salegentibacter mishustinae]GGW86652.1 L-threonine dehydratase [Salegentibacter mishustinae]
MDTLLADKKIYKPQVEAVKEAAERISKVVVKTPLMQSFTYTNKFSANVMLKREDLQQVRSYKIRGAYNKISSLPKEQLNKGVICASAGNHAQGVAFACNKLRAKGVIYMPITTPRQKVEQTKMFGGEWVEVVLKGDTFDDSFKSSMKHADKFGLVFIHPFDDEKVIEGQATIGLEILEQANEPIDYVFAPLGGGGLLAGISSMFKELSPNTKIIGVEPEGAASMTSSLKEGKLVELKSIERFVDGAAVQKVGSRNFEICKENLDKMITVPEGKICQTILDLYNQDAIVVEPAGAMAISALDFFAEEIKGKNVVCIVSGSNNDITRTAEIKERALLYAGLKHYFVISFPQRAGALKDFLEKVLGPKDDITHFEYSKKHHRENAPAVVGIEINDPADFEPLVDRMKANNFYGEYLNDKPNLFQYLV